jgi:hypothetical protein
MYQSFVFRVGTCCVKDNALNMMGYLIRYLVTELLFKFVIVDVPLQSHLYCISRQ